MATAVVAAWPAARPAWWPVAGVLCRWAPCTAKALRAMSPSIRSRSVLARSSVAEWVNAAQWRRLRTDAAPDSLGLHGRGWAEVQMQHRVVGGLLVRRDAVLLCHRRPDRRWYPGCWDLPGGHIEAGESARAALERECREELGIVVLRASPVEGVPHPPTVTLTVFAVESWAGEPVNRAPDEHDAVRWCSAAELAYVSLADPGLLPLLARAIHRTGT